MNIQWNHNLQRRSHHWTYPEPHTYIKNQNKQHGNATRRDARQHKGNICVLISSVYRQTVGMIVWVCMLCFVGGVREFVWFRTAWKISILRLLIKLHCGNYNLKDAWIHACMPACLHTCHRTWYTTTINNKAITIICSHYPTFSSTIPCLCLPTGKFIKAFRIP